MMRSLAILSLLALALVTCRSLPAEDAPPPDSEHWDRDVDQAALSAQKRAVAKYRALVKRYAKTDQERVVRMRLLESMEQAANLEFRIALGEAHIKKRPVDYTDYNATLSDVVTTSSALIHEKPLAEDAIRVYFLRAQAYNELKDIPKASSDYQFISQHFPGTTWAIRSDMALAGYAIDASDHRLAIEYLKKVEAFPDDKHYPLALYQLAWAYFNLNDIATAISYVKRHITYFKDLRDNASDKTLSTADQNSLEHSLKDLVTFYFEGLSKNQRGYALDDMLAVFRKVESGPDLGKMIVHFANLLRTQDRIDDLAAWQSQVIDEESDRPEAIDVVIAHLDCLYTHRLFDRAVIAAKGFQELDKKTKGRMRQYEGYAKAQELILSVATAIQKAIAATPDHDQSLALSRVLAGMYASFTAIVDDSDPRLAQIHYNLGETLFNIKEFDSAAAEYVWVLKHWQKTTKLDRADVSLKAIASRYQSFSGQNLLPRDLKPAAIAGEDKIAAGDLKAPVREWIGWIDDYLDAFGWTPPAFEQFAFEADRLLYVNGQTQAAVTRMLAQVKAKPASPTAAAEASLVLDTFVFSQRWQLLLDVSEAFLEMPALGDASFRKRLAGLPADASYKLMEESYQHKDYAAALKQAERFEKKYPAAPELTDCLYLASRAAEQMQDHQASLAYLSQLLTRFPTTDKRAVALLARGELEDKAYDFDAATQDYGEYLAAAKADDDTTALVRRYLFVDWLSRHPREPHCEAIAAAKTLHADCDRFDALIALETGSGLSAEAAQKKALSGEKDERPLWAAVALSGENKAIGWRDRLSIAQTFATGVSDEDPLVQVQLIAFVNRRLPEVLAEARRALPRLAPLKPNPGSISRRIELMKALETTASKVIKLPWARTKIAVLAEIAGAYQDFSTELAKLPPPKDLSPEDLAEYQKSVASILGPFQDKEKTIRSQVRELALAFPVEPSLAGLSTPARNAAAVPAPIDLAFLTSIAGTPSAPLYPKWEEAVKARAWARAGFFFQRLKEDGGQPAGTLSLMRAVSLAESSAVPEALAELDSALSGLKPGGVASVRRTLRGWYLASSAADKAKQYEEPKP
jgi:tetratricopeptide (TPR) repeat protein